MRDDGLSLHHTLRDFSSLLQLFGRLGSLFLGDSFKDHLTLGLDMVKQLLAIASFGSSQKLWRCGVSHAAIAVDLMEVHAQTLAALKVTGHILIIVSPGVIISSHLRPGVTGWPRYTPSR